MLLMTCLFFSLKEAEMQKAFVTDFDGTITTNDFFHIVTDNCCDEEGLKPWYDYLSGKITHLQALTAIFRNIKGSAEELIALIHKVEIDNFFYSAMQECYEKGIPVYIVSAGCDYYIRELIGDVIDKYRITLVANSCSYSETEGLKMLALPSDSPYYNEQVGVDKAAVIKELHKKGYEVIFAGDGRPDFAAAELSDVVFAKDMLLEKCQNAGIKTEKFNSYKDILDYIRKI